jgi:tellurite resistance protein
MSASTTDRPLPASAAAASSIKALPVSLFASVMGMSGLSLAWSLAHHTLGVSSAIGEGVGVVAILLFIAMSLGYLGKAIKFPAAVKAEFNHPIAGNFFGTITIGALLISSVLGSYSATLQQWVWSIGTLATLALGLVMVSRLLKGGFAHTNAVPALIIPGVASLDIAVAGGSMPMAWAHEVNLLAVAIGTMIAVVFFVKIFVRLTQGDALPAAMLPSMMIMMAPFEVGFLAYTNITHGVDMFAAMLFYFGLFLFLIIGFKIFRPSVPFSAGWWAMSFPLAALSSAALKYASTVQSAPLAAIAIALLLLLSIAIAVLFVRTLHLLFSGKLLAV